jgi:hypothetical protein
LRVGYSLTDARPLNLLGFGSAFGKATGRSLRCVYTSQTHGLILTSLGLQRLQEFADCTIDNCCYPA